jgi:hypothetical protein
MRDKGRLYFSMARTATSLQRAVTLAQSEAAQLPVIHLQKSLAHLVSLQQFLQLQLRIQWMPEQAQRQQERLARQQTRLQWQQQMLDKLHNK